MEVNSIRASQGLASGGRGGGGSWQGGVGRSRERREAAAGSGRTVLLK